MPGASKLGAGLYKFLKNNDDKYYQQGVPRFTCLLHSRHGLGSTDAPKTPKGDVCYQWNKQHAWWLWLQVLVVSCAFAPSVTENETNTLGIACSEVRLLYKRR